MSVFVSGFIAGFMVGGFLAARPALAYVRTTSDHSGAAVHWLERCITVRPDSRGSQDLPLADVELTLARAVDNWSSRTSSCGYLMLQPGTAAGGGGYGIDGRPTVVFRDRAVDGFARQSARPRHHRPHHRLLRGHARLRRRRHHPRRRRGAEWGRLHLQPRCGRRHAPPRHRGRRPGEHAHPRAWTRAGIGAYLLGPHPRHPAPRRPGPAHPRLPRPSAAGDPRHHHVPVPAEPRRDLQAAPLAGRRRWGVPALPRRRAPACLPAGIDGGCGAVGRAPGTRWPLLLLVAGLVFAHWALWARRTRRTPLSRRK